MAVAQGWRQVLQKDDTDVTFKVEGNEVLALSNHAGGVWQLDMLMPDDSVISLGTFESNDTQELIAPQGTSFRLHDGTAGATAWVGSAYSDPAGRLL